MNAARPKLRVACVGAGYFSRFHYDSWSRLERVALIASCNRDINKAQATGLPAYNDLTSMLVEQRPDLLDIILPPVAHTETIRTALAAGIKWIICQKPFCNTYAEAKTITAEAKSKGATIIVHENFRFQPWYRTIKTALDAGKIGHLRQVTFRLRPGDGQGPDAYLERQPYFQDMPKFLIHETGVHLIDTFRFLLGAPVAVYADLRKENPVIAGEDAGYVLFDHCDGVRALFDGNRTLDHAAQNLRCTMGEALIEGTHASMSLSGDGSVRLRERHTQVETMLLPPNTSTNFGGDCVHALQSHVVTGILDGTEFENTSSDYLIVLKTESAIYKSANTGRKIDLNTTWQQVS